MAQIIREGHDTDYTAQAIPQTERMPRFALTMSWWATCSAMFWLVISATIATNFGAVNTVIGLVLSAITFSIINAVIARYAVNTGLSVALFSKVLFGSIGADLATLILFATATYYAVFEGSVIAQAFHSYADIPLTAAYAIVVIYSVLFVFGSVQTWLDKLNGALLPLYLIGLVAAIIMAIQHYGLSSAWLSLGPVNGAPADGWWSCYVYYMGAWVIMMFTQDYARFGKPSDVAYHAHINFGFVFYTFTLLINGLVGIFLVGTVPSKGAISELAVVTDLLQLMGLAGLLFVWVSQTRMNTANFHIAAVNLRALAHRIPGQNLSRPFWAVIIGLLVFAIMLTNVFSFILQALAYQGVFIVAWVGIAVTHMISPRYKQMFGSEIEVRDDRVPPFNPGGLIAWFGATAVGIILLNLGPNLAMFSAPATVIVSIAIYAIALQRAHPSWFLRPVAAGANG